MRWILGVGVGASLCASASGQVQYVINSPAEALGNIEDMNLDARRELILGIPSASKVEVRSGSNGVLMSAISGGFPASSRFGASVDVVVDLDLDGNDDVIAGAPSHGVFGRVIVASSTTGATLRSFGPLSSTPNTCPTHPKLYGTSVRAIGDLTGDGFSEYAIGAPGWEGTSCIDQGIVEIVDVRPATPVLVNVLSAANLGSNGAWVCGVIHDAQFGQSIGALGDGNGDGLPELAIGAPGADVGVVFDGVTCIVGGTPTVSAYMKGGASASLGFSMSGIGDLNTDGVGDLVVGTPNLSGLPADLATTYRYSGAALANGGGNVVPPLGALGFGAAFGRQLGWSVARIRDANGDGVQDYIAGAGSPCNLVPGAHYVISGANGGILQFVIHASSSTYGQAVFPTGNLGFGNRPSFMVADPSNSQVTVRS